MTQQKGDKKAAQQPSEMRRIVHHHALKAGIQGKNDHQDHPLYRDLGRPPLSRDHQIKQTADQPEDRAARPYGFIKAAGGKLINSGKKISAYSGNKEKDQITQLSHCLLHDLSSKIQKDHVVRQMADIRMQKHRRNETVIFSVPEQIQNAERSFFIKKITVKPAYQEHNDIHCCQNRAAPWYSVRFPLHFPIKLLCPHMFPVLFWCLSSESFQGYHFPPFLSIPPAVRGLIRCTTARFIPHISSVHFRSAARLRPPASSPLPVPAEHR